jgi:hypothetical protein
VLGLNYAQCSAFFCRALGTVILLSRLTFCFPPFLPVRANVVPLGVVVWGGEYERRFIAFFGVVQFTGMFHLDEVPHSGTRGSMDAPL